ncbi:MAG: DegT/DnrJ/EryC1/StrS family aminotransferase [Planctomycetes bacterium]|nr:DegT/DnrJ/EryC1/StrS family aminotransferase [Planctomycetota bacterium]
MSEPSDRTVPFFDYPALSRNDEQQLVEIFRDICRRGAYISQSDMRDFEQELARYVGARYVLGMANATDALHLAVRAAGIGAGDEVLFSSHTMVATAAAVAYAGAKPIPVECGADHLIEPDCLEEAITARTRAIIPTQLNGRTAKMDAIMEIAERHGLLVLEDAAQALGSRYRGRCAGTFGLASCVSFYPAKTLGCLGDGGCVITNDESIYRKLCLLRDHGRDERGEVITWGLNSRLDNLQAAILRFKLPNYPETIERRRAIARRYQQRLGDLPGLVLPPAPDSHPDHYDIFQNYEIEADRRDALRAYLQQRGVGTLVQWGGKAVHQFQGLGYRRELPRTERLFQRLLLLPMNQLLSDQDVEYICDQICAFCEQQAIRRSAA